MKAAGINPILAAMNGGASSPSGATASGSSAHGNMANSAMASSGMASMSSGSAPMASSSSYTGQGNNMSENLAMFGAIASMFGQGMSALAESFNIGDGLAKIAEFFMKGEDGKNFIDNVTGAANNYAGQVTEGIANAVGNAAANMSSSWSDVYKEQAHNTYTNEHTNIGYWIGKRIRNLFN